jgi:hypothetical protein
VGAVALLSARALTAQQPRLATLPAPVTVPAAAAWTTGHVTVPDSVRETHWARGGLVGGLIGGMAFGALSYSLCTGLNEDSSVDCEARSMVAALTGAALGFTIGALIGGQNPKEP